MSEKLLASAGIGGIVGYIIGSAMKPTPQPDISTHQKRIELSNPLPEGRELILAAKPAYVFNIKNWKYGCVYLYTTPQGDVNAIVEVSKYYDGHYEAEIARMCGGELKISIDGVPAKSFPATPPEVHAIGYLAHIF